MTQKQLITAIKHNLIVKALAERLEKRGKNKKVMMGAARGKLLHLAFGVLGSKTHFDHSYSL